MSTPVSQLAPQNASIGGLGTIGNDGKRGVQPKSESVTCAAKELGKAIRNFASTIGSKVRKVTVSAFEGGVTAIVGGARSAHGKILEFKERKALEALNKDCQGQVKLLKEKSFEQYRIMRIQQMIIALEKCAVKPDSDKISEIKEELTESLNAIDKELKDPRSGNDKERIKEWQLVDRAIKLADQMFYRPTLKDEIGYLGDQIKDPIRDVFSNIADRFRGI